MNSNILFFVIDSFRADKFENSSAICPNLNSLKNNGVYFTQTISSADATLLSEASIFTGKFPFKTGIHSEKLNKLDKDIITFFQVLQKNDYHFYSYLPSIVEIVGLFPKFENDDNSYTIEPCLTKGLNKKILDKLENNSLKEPWLFYIHVMDLHNPIDVPKEFQDKKFGKTTYEKQISALDNLIGIITKKLDLEKTLFVLTADHGAYVPFFTIDGHDVDLETNSYNEMLAHNLGQKIPKFMNPLKNKIFMMIENTKQKQKQATVDNLDLKPHQKRALTAGKINVNHVLYDELIRVPLLFVGSNMKKNLTITKQIRTVDIFPTMLDALNLSPILEKIDGQSLIPLIDGKITEEQVAYMETNPKTQLESNDVIGIRTSSFKYFRDIKNPNNRVHLFDLNDDPMEDKNIAKINPKKVKEMEQTLQNLLNDNNRLKKK